MKINFAPWLAVPFILLTFVGCSDSASAEKRISIELKHFADQYIKLEFAKQIKLNGQCKAFRIKENSLLLLGFDGIDVVERTLAHKDLHEFAVSRYYVGQELKIDCKEASWSNLTKVNHDKYTYRALVTYKFTDTRRMWQRVPGNSIVLTAFKQNTSPAQLKSELLNQAASALPDEKFDYCAIYNRASQAKERNFNVSFFVCYDPAKPGWIPEEPELTGEIKVDAVAPDWLDYTIDKFKPGANLEFYKEDFYWNKCKTLRKNYDDGLVFRYNQWMTEAQAEERARFEELVNKFDPDRADINQLSDFMRKLKGFSDKQNFNSAWQKALYCAENQINKFRNEDKYKELESFYRLMQGNPDYAPVFAQLQNSLLQAVAMVKRRINRQLEGKINEISSILNDILKFNGQNEFTATQINIECVRKDNALKKLCPQDSEKISQEIFKIRFLLLLAKRDIAQVNKLYRDDIRQKLLRELEKMVLKNCQNCRRGMQKCIYCEKNPGVCSLCENKRPTSDERCSNCKGNGLCVHCRGTKVMKCMNCQGRKFVILHSQAAKLCQESFAELQKILQNNMADLQNKKLKL